MFESGKSEAEALAEIGRIVTSSPNFHEVLDATAKHISTLIPAETISLSTVDIENHTFSTLFRWGLELPIRSLDKPRQLEGTGAEAALEAGRAIVLSPDLRDRQQSNWAGDNLYPLAGMKSWLIAPMMFGGKPTGVLHIRTADENAYSEEHLKLADNISNQIAGPVTLAEMRDNLVKSERELSALATLAVELAEAGSSTEMYESVEKTIAEFMEFDRISIVTVDSTEKSLIQTYQNGFDVPGIEIGSVLNMHDSDEKFYAWASELTSNSEGGEYLPGAKVDRTHKQMGLESRMRTPLRTSTGYVGAIALNHKAKNMYSATDQQFLRKIASQAAPALEKALLIERSEIEVRTQSSIARIVRAVSEDLDIKNVYRRTAEELKTLIPYDRISISIFDENTQVMTSEFYQGIPIPNAMPEDDITDPGKTIDWHFAGDESNQAYGSSTSKESDFERVLEELGLVSWIQAPFGVQSTGPIGFLSLRSKTKNQYVQKDIEILRQVATLVTPAIQNAKLFAQAKALAEQLQRTNALDDENRELQRVAEARSRFLSTVSHELRTPLTAISAFSDILSHNRPGNLDERQQSHVEAIRRSTIALTKLVDDLLDVSRADSGQLSLDRAPADFKAIISDFAGVGESIATQKNQNLKINNFEAPVWVDVDKSRINQILNNLVSNASKYSADASQISISGSIRSDSVEIEVQDSGIGITPQDIQRVFIPFFRADNIDTQSQPGSGLGLSVVKTLAELHDGSVEIKSDPGFGTTVSIRIPGVLPGPV